MWKTYLYQNDPQNISPLKRSKILSTLLALLLILLYPQLTLGAEHVIFEQIGQLAGSTSYLHAHITVSVSSIDEQLLAYEKLLKTDYTDYKEVYELIRHNLGSYQNAENPRNFSDAKLYTAAMSWTQMARLHVDDTIDIRDHINSLRNMLPDRPGKDANKVTSDSGFVDGRLNSVDYVSDEPRPPNPIDVSKDTLILHLPDDDAISTSEPSPPFPFKASPLHEAAHRYIIKQEVNLGIVSEINTTPSPKLNSSVNITTDTNILDKPAPLLANISILPTESTIPVNRPRTAGAHQRWPMGHRRKRVAGIIALPIAIAATAMGIYNSVQIEFLKTELLEVKDNVNRLFEVLQKFDKEFDGIGSAIRDLADQLLIINVANPAFFDARLTRIENQIRQRLRMATHALQTAQHRRLAVDYLSPQQIRNLFTKLKERAAEFGCELLITHHSDLFQIEVSLLFDGQDAHLLVHVPMVPINSLLRLFKLHPFPLPFFDDHFLIPDVQHDVLAVSSNDHRLSTHLSSVDLLGCHRVNQIFMCDRFGVLSRQFNNTCLGSLFVQDFKTARTTCKFEVSPVTEKVFQLRKNWFAAYLPGPATIPIKCRNGTVTEKHLGRGSQQFHLSPGCEAYFSTHQVFSDLSIKMPAEIIHFEWTWEPLTMLDLLPSEVTPELDRLRQFGVNRPALMDLQYMAAQRSQNSWTIWSHITHYVGNAVLIILIVGLALWIGIRCYRYRKAKKPQNHHDDTRDPEPDPGVVAAAAVRLLGANTPAFLRRQRSSSVPPSAPRNDVRYHAANQQIQMPYHVPHSTVRSEMERQAILQHLQNEINRINSAPCSHEDQNFD